VTTAGTSRARPAAVPAAVAHRTWARASAFNWRLFAVRVVTNGLAVVLTALLVPGLDLGRWRLGGLAVLGLVFGLLNAVVKPALQFLALRFLVATYGLVVVVINAAMLFLLELLLPELISSDRLWHLLLGGLVVGVLGLVLDTLAGASRPVLDNPGLVTR
jgi:putative membrane protein